MPPIKRFRKPEQGADPQRRGAIGPSPHLVSWWRNWPVVYDSARVYLSVAAADIDAGMCIYIDATARRVRRCSRATPGQGGLGAWPAL